MQLPVVVDDVSRHRYHRGFWAPTRGIRLPDDRRDHGARCDALHLALPEGHTFSGETALRLWEGVEAREDIIEVTLPRSTHPIRRAGVRVRRRDVPVGDVVVVSGRPLTTPQRTFVDVARHFSVPRLVAVGDDLIRRRLCHPDDIEAVLSRSPRQRGVLTARRAATLLDPRSESPRESITRALIIEAGLPRPVPQVDIFDDSGRFIARGDLVYEKERVVVEYDGYHHLTREGQRSDAHRRGELGIAGWLIVTIVPADIHTPRLLIAKVVRALGSR